MRGNLGIRLILFLSLAAGSTRAAQNLTDAEANQGMPPKTSDGVAPGQAPGSVPGPETKSTLDKVIDRAIAREREEITTFERYSPIIETYIQEVKPDNELGTVPRKDVYFLGQADFKRRVKVHSLVEPVWKPSLMWSFYAPGFLQMIFIDRGEFDRAHYRFTYAGREFLGEVRCYVFDVERAPKVRGARFTGRIWVEDRDYTVVRINGVYAPSIHFSVKTFDNEYYLHFDSWRTNVRSGMWLPSYVYSQEAYPPTRFGNPSYKSQTHLWAYKPKAESREEELNRLLVESSSAVKDEANQHDRSPLEAEREWRHEGENNVLDLLEGIGLLAPPGPVDTVLNVIVNNLEITNNLDGQIDLHCRVLLTSNLEMFSVGNTIVLSRGLIDVVPDEATMAAMLAHEMADAMLTKPYQDQYGFSDILRMPPDEVLHRLSFKEDTTEATENSKKAAELLKKSPYAAKLGNAALFLAQLHSQSKELKQLINPRLGNQVFYAEELGQTAPALERGNKGQIAALPMGSRVKVDAWGAGASLMKSRPVGLLSARDKMPFEVTPLVPYLTRYVETSALQTDPTTTTTLDP
jgi:hypothetical protein